ncbi:MAG: FAD-dependent oxidoreductase [Ruminococcus sp.]|nr:FAD-dependent oxidoreductase [Ruminococcus sp.]
MYGYPWYDVIVVGSGPAGLTAASFCARGGLKTAMIEIMPESGGQMVFTDIVDNYPGLGEVKGVEIGLKMREWAKKTGVVFHRGQATRIETDYAPGMMRLLTGAVPYKGRSIIWAAGGHHKHLGIDKEEDMIGRGVSYCATCDGVFYRGKSAVVIGGGNSALRYALYLSNICKRVVIVHRRKEFTGQRQLLEKCEAAENIEIVRGAVCQEIYGEKKVSGVGLIMGNGVGKYIQCDGLFIAIGSYPASDVLQGICELDEKGYVIAGEDCVTSAPGIFAAGDVRTKNFRQIITAAADGANAARSAELYLLEHEYREE